MRLDAVLQATTDGGQTELYIDGEMDEELEIGVALAERLNRSRPFSTRLIKA